MADKEIAQRHIKELHNPCSLYIGGSWIWLRIHKTAGTSMYDVLRDDCINIAKENQEDKVAEWMAGISKIKLNNKFIWSFVRNPYDRFVSSSVMFGIDPNRFAKQFNRFRSLKGIITRHSEPQHTFTHYNGFQIPNFIGRFENLENDWHYVMCKIGLPYFELPRKNESKHGKWQDILTEESKAFVREFYKLDFEYFGYEK